MFTLVCIISAVLATVITLPVYAASGIRSAEEVWITYVDMEVGFPKGWVSRVPSVLEVHACLSL